MIKVEMNKGEGHIEFYGNGADILAKSIMIVKELLDDLSKESKIVGLIFKSIVEESVFNDTDMLEEMLTGHEHEKERIAMLMEQLTERRLQDEE